MRFHRIDPAGFRRIIVVNAAAVRSLHQGEAAAASGLQAVQIVGAIAVGAAVTTVVFRALGMRRGEQHAARGR